MQFNDFYEHMFIYQFDLIFVVVLQMFVLTLNNFIMSLTMTSTRFMGDKASKVEGAKIKHLAILYNKSILIMRMFTIYNYAPLTFWMMTRFLFQKFVFMSKKLGKKPCSRHGLLF